MAIDSANKRYSLLKALPVPDGSLDSAPDRLQLLGLYSGFSMAVVAPPQSTVYVERVVEVVMLVLPRKSGSGSDTFYVGHEYWDAGTLYSGSPVVYPVVGDVVTTPRGVDRVQALRSDVSIGVFGKSHLNEYGKSFLDLVKTHELQGAEVQVRRYVKSKDGLAAHSAASIRQTLQIQGWAWDGAMMRLNCRDTFYEDKEVSKRLMPSDFVDLQQEFQYQIGATVFGTGDAGDGVIVDAPFIEATEGDFGNIYADMFLAWTYPGHANEGTRRYWVRNTDRDTDDADWLEIEFRPNPNNQWGDGYVPDIGSAYPRYLSLYSRGVVTSPGSLGKVLTVVRCMLRPTEGYWCADFNGSNNLYYESGRAYSFDDNSFTFAVRVRFDSVSGNRAVFGKGRINKLPDPDLEYWLLRHNSGVLRFGISGTGLDADVQVNSSVTVPADVWVWVVCGYDQLNRQIFIQVNNGTVSTADTIQYGTITGSQRGTDSVPAYLQVSSGFSAANNFYNGWRLMITAAGDNQGKHKPVFTYTGSNRRAFFETNWSPQPASGNAVVMYVAPFRKWRQVEKEGAFEVGYIGHDGVNHFDGKMAMLGCWSGVLGASQRTFIYNGGNVRPYEQLTDSEKFNMVSYHNLDEFYGTRYDSHSNKHLNDAGSVGSVAGGANQSPDFTKGELRLKIAKAVYKPKEATWAPEESYRDYPVDMSQVNTSASVGFPTSIPVDPPLPLSPNGSYFIYLENTNNKDHQYSYRALYNNASGRTHYARINDESGRSWVPQNNVGFYMDLYIAGNNPGFSASSGTPSRSTYRIGSYASATYPSLVLPKQSKNIQYRMSLRGLQDNGSGTYTGTPNVSIRNAADVLRFAVMNPDFGLGLSSAKVDTSSFDAARAWCASKGLYLSFAVDSETFASDLIVSICEQTGMVFYKSRDGKLKLKTPAYHGGWFAYRLDEGRHRGQLGILSVDDAPGEGVHNDFVVNYGSDPLNLPKDPDFVFKAGSSSYAASVQINGASTNTGDAARVAKLAASEAKYGRAQYRKPFDKYAASESEGVKGVVDMLIDRWCEKTSRVTIRVPLKDYFAVDLFDTFSVRHTALPGAAGTTKKFYWNTGGGDDGEQVAWHYQGVPIAWLSQGKLEGEVVNIVEFDQSMEITVETQNPF